MLVTSRWATQRKVFGKPLIGQPVVRAKIAGMIARVESLQAWLGECDTSNVQHGKSVLYSSLVYH